MRETVCKSSEKGKKRRKHQNLSKRNIHIKKEKQKVDSYLAGAYWVFNTIKYTYLAVSIYY